MTIQLLIDSKFNAQGVKQAETRLRGMLGGLDDLFKQANDNQLSGLQGLVADKFLGGNFEDKIHDSVSALKQYSVELRNSAKAALALGDAQKATGMLDAADQAENLANRFNSLSEEQQNSGNLLDFINNKFNKFAFGLFVVTGAIETVKRAVSQLTEFLIDGASQADRLSTFTVLMSEAGTNANKMAADLRNAAQGAVTLDTAIRPTLQLLKAGLPEAAAQTDALLKIATNAAILSGDLSQVDTIYEKLVRGIVRGSPRLIDDADIILKLGDAYQTYADKMNIVGRELDANEQKLATLDAVLQEGTRINELADQVDSSALALQQLKIDATEAGEAIKRTFAAGVAETIKAMDDFADMFDPLLIDFAKLITGSEEVATAFEMAFDAKPIQVFVRGILTSFDLLGAHIRGRAAEIVEVWNALVSAIVTGGVVIESIFKRLTGELTADEAMKQINDQLALFAQRTADAVNPSNQLNQELGDAAERARAAGEELGFYGEQAEAAGAAAASAANAVNSDFNALSGAIQDAIEARTGIDAQFAERRVEIEEDLRDKILEINETLGEKLAAASDTLKQRLLDNEKDYKEAIAKLSRDTADRLTEIDEDLTKKLSEASDKAAEDRKTATENKNKGIEDAYEKHQQKLIDIERKYEMARLKALIDRDARALWEAEQSRAEGQKEATDDLADQINEEEDQYKEQLDRIAKQEEDRRKQAIEAAEERRQDTLKAEQTKLNDLKASYEKEKAEARKAYSDSRAAAIKAAGEQRQDALKAQRESLQDLQKWYQEQLTLQKERQLQEKISELEHLQEMGELTQAHINELKAMWSDYNGFTSGATSSSGGSGISGITPGGGGTMSGLVPGGGGNTGGGGTLSGITQGAQPGDPMFPGFPGSTSRTLNGTSFMLDIRSNDKTLEEVLRSQAYSAVLEVVED